MRPTPFPLLLLIAACLASFGVAAQQPGLYRPAPVETTGSPDGPALDGPELDGTLRLCPLDVATMAYDLRLGPVPGPEAPEARGCVAFGLMEVTAAGLVARGDGYHLVVEPAGDDAIVIGSVGSGGTLCTHAGLADGTWRRAGDCAVWRPLEIEQTQVMLRDLGLIGAVPMRRAADEGAAADLARLLDGLAPGYAGAPAQAIATLVRLDWRRQCGGDGTC